MYIQELICTELIITVHYPPVTYTHIAHYDIQLYQTWRRRIHTSGSATHFFDGGIHYPWLHQSYTFQET